MLARWLGVHPGGSWTWTNGFDLGPFRIRKLLVQANEMVKAAHVPASHHGPFGRHF